ncbi:GNAT family N-acetyltransferase [Novispirillum itersonii]|uniref:Putative N-acetyltransferase YhbS n=1 Tax=Novispirillum itersonii TaxID=189 RepID=A0A7W9ZF84_NOVIT|nr:N-acetyltransferase [Novispirillum itersonii]MBB6210140.1 putative N-acetyltransferase YhbS [Novispirillum itersonii]
MIQISHETAADHAGIETLLDLCFGPDRTLKTCQRLRDGQAPVDGLAFVIRDSAQQVIATLRFWAISIGGETRSLLLGPLAVHPRLQSLGLGSRLIRYGINQAAALGHGSVVLVGDEPYYRRFGFEAGLTLDMDLPGPVDRARFLALELRHGALTDARGMITPVETGDDLPSLALSSALCVSPFTPSRL